MSISISFVFTEKFICIESCIGAGFVFTNFDIEPIYLDIDVDNIILGQNIKVALSKSIDILDDEKREKTFQQLLSSEHLEKTQAIKKERAKELKKRYGYKTLKELNKDYMYVGVGIIDDTYTFTPNLTNKGGATGIGEKRSAIPFNSTNQEIGQAIRTAMSLCKSIYK